MGKPPRKAPHRAPDDQPPCLSRAKVILRLRAARTAFRISTHNFTHQPARDRNATAALDQISRCCSQGPQRSFYRQTWGPPVTGKDGVALRIANTSPLAALKGVDECVPRRRGALPVSRRSAMELDHQIWSPNSAPTLDLTALQQSRLQLRRSRSLDDCARQNHSPVHSFESATFAAAWRRFILTSPLESVSERGACSFVGGA